MNSGILKALNKVAVPAVALAGMLASAQADASIVPVGPGGFLNLTAANSGNNNSSNPATGNWSAVSSGGGYDYGNGFSSAQTSNFSTTGFGFYDDYVFTVGAGQVDSITSTITIGSTAGISGLSVRLYDYNANGQLVPLTTTPSPGSAFDAWSTSVPVSPGATATYNVLPVTDLAAGTYVIEVRGTATGTHGGSYSGVLDVTPVPLPAALPLLLSGLVGLSGWRSRRKALAAA